MGHRDGPPLRICSLNRARRCPRNQARCRTSRSRSACSAPPPAAGTPFPPCAWSHRARSRDPPPCRWRSAEGFDAGFAARLPPRSVASTLLRTASRTLRLEQRNLLVRRGMEDRLRLRPFSAWRAHHRRVAAIAQPRRIPPAEIASRSASMVISAVRRFQPAGRRCARRAGRIAGARCRWNRRRQSPRAPAQPRGIAFQSGFTGWRPNRSSIATSPSVRRAANAPGTHRPGAAPCGTAGRTSRRPR